MPLRSSCLFFLLLVPPLRAQDVVLRVRVTAESQPLAGVRVRVDTLARVTDGSGVASFPVTRGAHRLRIEHAGYAPLEREVAGEAGEVTVELARDVVAIEAIVVTSTRGQRRVEDEPVRVEVVAREEVEEKLLMTPSDIAMLLNETSGVRVQPASAALGGAGIRIQGLPGRYTQLLVDGLPLHGTQPSALGPLQIPPLDLQQVEVIKGPATALYGPGALGGVVNLRARVPDGTREALYNESMRGATDALVWWSSPAGPASWSLTGGMHTQTLEDVDGDGWADIASYRRGALRPRLFVRTESGSSLLATAGVSWEEREGGAMPGVQRAPTPAFRDAQETRRADLGLNGRWVWREQQHVGVRAVLASERYLRKGTNPSESGLRSTGLLEATLTGARAGHEWLVGAGVQREALTADRLAQHDFRYVTPSVFVQDEFTLRHDVVLAGSARYDHHSEYGSFVSPRFSVLYRPDEWTLRLSGTTGFFAPTPFTETTEATGLRRLLPLGGLSAERARSIGLDVGRTLGVLELNASAFAAHIDDPVQTIVPGAPRLQLVNALSPLRTRGLELFARVHTGPLHAAATYAHTRGSEADPEILEERRALPLVPRHSAGLVGAWELEGRGRIAAEAYYIGRQSLDDNPYRRVSKPYLLTGLLLEARVGRVRLFVNGENLTDVRQTRTDPLLREIMNRDGLWPTDVWAPLEGRTINGGVRVIF